MNKIYIPHENYVLIYDDYNKHYRYFYDNDIKKEKIISFLDQLEEDKEMMEIFNNELRKRKLNKLHENSANNRR